jgi:uncharacterized protein YceK
MLRIIFIMLVSLIVVNGCSNVSQRSQAAIKKQNIHRGFRRFRRFA